MVLVSCLFVTPPGTNRVIWQSAISFEFAKLGNLLFEMNNKGRGGQYLHNNPRHPEDAGYVDLSLLSAFFLCASLF